MKTNILFLDHTPFIGGAQISLIQHIKRIDKEKFNIIVGCSYKAKELNLAKRYDQLNIKYYFIPFGRLKELNLKTIVRILKSIKDVRHIIKKDKVHVVLGNTVRANIVGSLAVLNTDTKLIWLIQDITFPKILFKILSFIPKRIIFISKYLTKYYNKNLSNKNKVVHIWREGFSGNNAKTEEETEKNKTSLYINDHNIVIGCISRLVPDKGIHILIESINQLVNESKVKSLKCIIVGTGKGQKEESEDELKKMIGKYNLGNYINIVGHQENIFSYLKMFNVFCLPSIAPEGVPTVIIEAMMARVAVIATSTGGTPEVVINEKTGLLIEPNNIKALSDAILRLVNDNDLKVKLAGNGYEYVIENHTSKTATRKLEHIYKEVL